MIGTWMVLVLVVRMVWVSAMVVTGRLNVLFFLGILCNISELAL
jgi:hypothetical protein